MSRPQPSAIEAEKVVLGAMLTDRNVIDELPGQLVAEKFYLATHAAIFAAILEAHADGEPTESPAIASRLASAGMLAKVGGGPYLLELVQAVPATVQAGWYAEQILTTAAARGMDVLGSHAHQYAYTTALEDFDLARQRLQDELDALGARPDDNAPVRWSDLATPGVDAIEAAAQPDSDGAAISTGLADLDDALGGGLRVGQLVVVAGRTGMGKSVLSRNIARAAALHNKLSTIIFTLEMTGLEVFNCIVAAELRIDLSELNSGEVSDSDWIRIANLIADTADAPLWVDDTPGINLAEIRAKARAHKKRHGLQVIIVDYLGLVETSSGRDNRQVAVAALSRGLRVLALELEIVVILVAQLNRGPEMRQDKTPQLADLRESGAIENDANTVLLIHRDDYYNKDSPRRGEADLIVAKQRSGPKTTVTVAAQLHHSRFASMG